MALTSNRGVIRELVESHVRHAGGDFKEGTKRAAGQLGRLIDTGDLSLENVSIREAFKAFVPLSDAENMSAGAIAEAMVSSAFPYITTKLIHKTIIDAYNYALGDVSSMVAEYDSNRKEENVVGFGAADNLELVGENMPYTVTEMAEKYCVIKNWKFGRIIELTKEMVIFDQTGQVKDRAMRVGEKAGLQRHQFIVQKATSIACTPTNESANYSLYYDGSYRTMFANDHSSWDVQTNDNLDTTAFGTAGVQALHNLLMQQKDTKGDYVAIQPKVLLVHVAKQWDAYQLTNSDKQYDNANNAINPVKGLYKVIASPYVTGSGYYYLGDFAKQTRWQWVWRPLTEQQAVDSDASFDRDVVTRYKFSYYGGCGCTDYRYVAMGGS